jgi:Domain of unknown function (DUF4386)
MTPLSKKARLAGLLYLVASLVGFLRLIYIPNALIVDGNAAATASNIVAHESLFRWGFVSELLASVLWLFVPLALYRLLKGVDQGLAILMVILGSLMVTPLFFVNALTDAGALTFATGVDFLAVFDKPKRDAFTMLFLNLHHDLDSANAIFWGLWLIPFGLLVYRSRFLPRFLGVWLIVGCFAYLAFSGAHFLFPSYEEKVFAIGQPFRMGELATMLWLVIMGARERSLAKNGSKSG